MASQPRLFTRTREPHKDIKHLSSKISIIVLLKIYSDDTRLRQRLSRLPDSHYFRAETINNCLNLILQEDSRNAFIMLITSNQFIDFIQNNLLENVPQLSHIYLLDNMLYNQQLSSNQRFRGTFHNVEKLFETLHADIEKVRSSNRMAEGIQYVLEDSAKFFWYRFLFNILDRLQHTAIAMRELIYHARYLYQHDRYQLDVLNELERTYCSAYVIRWYTKDCFFYQRLNQALRSHDINEIFLWRAYIQDLDRCLRQIRLQHTKPQCEYMYRGQVLHIDDLKRQREGVGQLITMTSFSSTSRQAVIARTFVGNNMALDSSLQSVVYRITVDSNNTKSVYADVQDFSHSAGEAELLFSIRSLFRIERVDFIDDCWQIDLTAVDEDDQQFCEAINPWKATIGEQSFFSGHHQPLFTRYLNIENSSFLSFQLLIDLILRLDRNEFAREEMIEMCLLKYTNSPADLKKIDEFEREYDCKDAAKWYTSDSFLYRLLNNSLRLEDIDTLVKLRCYIYDLHNQLAQLQTAYIQSLPTNESKLILYRGQRMSITELENLRQNVGNLISMNSFLSTTDDVQAAVFFAGDGSLDMPKSEVSVLYQITVDINIPHSIPFAKIQYESIFEDEDEVLFSMASVFRIDILEQYGQLWVADLTLINKEDENWNELTAHLNK